MIKKSWEKFSSEVSEDLNKKLDKKTVESVMEVLNSKKNRLTASEKKSRKKKDPNAPKRWNTSYIIFCIDYRQKLKRENPNLPTTEITSKLGTIWKSLSEKERSHYEQLSKKDKERYENEMKKYSPNTETTESEPKKQSKRPLTAYMRFCQQKRSEFKNKNPTLSSSQVTSELAKVWKTLSEKEKQQYQTKEEDEKFNSIGFKHFAKDRFEELQEEHSDWSEKKINSQICKLWKALPTSEKEEFENEANECLNVEEEEEIESELEDDE